MNNEIKKESAPHQEVSRLEIPEEAIHKLISSARNQRDRLVLELLIYTAARRLEVILLRRKDVILQQNLIMMPTVKRKDGDAYKHRRPIPIFDEKLKIDLESYMELTAIKFHLNEENRLIRSIQSREKEGLDPAMINKIVRETAERAGVSSPDKEIRKYVAPHLLRHNFVRIARQRKLDYKIIQEILGHKDIKSTFNLYGKPSIDEIRSEIKKMEGFA
jgi:integrase